VRPGRRDEATALVVNTPQNLRQRLYGRKVVFHLRRADARLVELVRAFPFAETCRRSNWRAAARSSSGWTIHKPRTPSSSADS